MNNIKQIAASVIYAFLNYFVSYIPCWHIRKLVYMLFGMKIGKGSRIYMGCTVISPWKIIIGNNSFINERCVLDGRGGLKIGNNSSISMQSVILTASHDKNSSDFLFYSAPVTIGDNVWMGTRAMVLDGSIIEDLCIIAAGSVIKGKTEKSTIYLGIPAKAVKKRIIGDRYQLDYRDYIR